MSNSALRVLAGAGAIDDPVYVDDVFSTFLYEGNGTSQTITSGIDLDGKGGLVWTKARENTSGGATGHALIDTERGKTKWLSAEGTSAEQTNANLITAFNSNGHTVGSGGPYWTNDNGYDYVSWTFRKQPGFFDIVTYTGTGNTTGGSPQWREISHNLGTAPGMIIVKNTTGTGINNWFMWHRSVPDDSIYAASTGFLNTTSDFGGYSGFQTNANQTATHFSLRQNSSGQTNDSGDTYVAYLFAHDAQDFGTDEDEAIIKCGSYTGNGSSSGVTVDLGFEPQWLFVKMSSHSGYYSPLVDSMRGFIVGGNDATVWPNVADAEYSGANYLDPTSTGFIATDTNNTNLSGKSYIYVAIRRPHKPASEFAATDLFSLGMGLNASAGEKVYSSTFPVDFVLSKKPSGTSDWYVRDRLRPFDNYLNPNDPRAASSNTYENELDHMDGVYTTSASNTTTWMSWLWKRAPGFFDVVAYTGSGSGSTVVKHNLGVVPEMVWRKRRDASQQYYIWASALSGAGTAQANGNFYTSSQGFSNGQYYAGDTQFDNVTPPTATEFTQGALKTSSAQYMIYLFASVAGISKIGTYTGTGSDLNVDCGFSAGARFVLIKRIDATGDWYVYDSVRGIVAGNDPYIFVNSNAGGVTNTDYIDPLSSGFTITSSAPAALNASSGEYLFLAIA